MLAGTETHGDVRRVVNAMMTAKELIEAETTWSFCSTAPGTQWPGILADPDHNSHRLFERVREVVPGACAYCSRAFVLST